MAKKQLKKVNQPKKYLQGGSNMGSVAQMKQTPYYLGQVEAGAAEDKLEASTNALARTRMQELENKGVAEEQVKEQNDQFARNTAKSLLDAGVQDQKAGNLGKLLLKTPSAIGNPNPFAFMQAPAQSIGTGTAIEGVGVLAPQYMPAAQAGLGTGVDAGVGVLAPEYIAPAAEIGKTTTAATGTAGLSGLATAGIGAALTGAGMITERKTDDRTDFYNNKRERRGNVAGEALKGAGAGFVAGAALGAQLGTVVPGAGNVIGGVAGGLIGAGVGALKARKENKANTELAGDLQRRSAEQRGAYQSAFINSRLGTLNQGFGYASNNVGNSATTQYQVAKTGGVKYIPGGKIVPIEGTDAIEYVGRSHEEGGMFPEAKKVGGKIKDKGSIEVEGGETEDQVIMEDNNKKDYIFSKYLKLGGKSFAQRHKEILKSNGSQAEIQQLAAMQEKVAGRDPQQVAVAKYGGIHKYETGGAACPEGYVMDANGNCVPVATSENTIAVQNGTANAPADTKVTYPPFGDVTKNFNQNQEAVGKDNYEKYGIYKPPRSQGNMYGNRTKTGKEALEAGMARSAEDDKLRAEKEAQLNAPNTTAPVNPGVQPPANTQPAAQTTLADDIDKMWADKGYVKDANGDWVFADVSQQQSVAQVDNTVAPDGTKLPAGYVWDKTLNQPISATAMSSAAAASANKAGTATYTAPTGVTPQTVNTGASTDPTITYTNSNAPTAPQTPEEKEAARLAGLPRYFMGANRKVDEATGEVTAYTDKPLMGVGAMAGSRLGTAGNSPEELAKITNNSYDQAWTNKADNLYTNQKDASGGGLSSSDAIADRDKIAESNWGQKYGYKKGMSADEAKAAHGKFAEDVKSLFANNPDEMMGYFQYIIDGEVNDPKAPGTYLGKDAEQIRNNLKTKGYIDANGQPIAGKVVAGKTMAQYLEDQATNNAVGPIHNALGSYTAERSATKIKLEEQKKKEVETPVQELPKKFEPCPPGNYRSQDGSCQPVPPFKQKDGISGSMLAGFGQLIPMGAALLNPYKISPGIAGAPAIKGPLLYRNNMNQDRAAAIQNNVAMKNAVVNQNAGPGGLAVLAGANAALNSQMLKIAQQEQDANKQLAAEEGKLGMQASMFNAENAMKRQMFNAELSKDERRYGREDMLGALSGAARGVAGIVRDEKLYAAQERLARTDETGSYDRFATLEQLQKEAKRKGSPFYGKTEAELRRIASAMYKELNPEGYVSKSEYTKLQEEKDKLQKEKEEAAKKNQAKFGGARQYVSRLGQLSGVRATKAKL